MSIHCFSSQLLLEWGTFDAGIAPAPELLSQIEDRYVIVCKRPMRGHLRSTAPHGMVIAMKGLRMVIDLAELAKPSLLGLSFPFRLSSMPLPSLDRGSHRVSAVQLHL